MGGVFKPKNYIHQKLLKFCHSALSTTLFFLATAGIVDGLISIYKQFTNKVFDVWPLINSKQRKWRCALGELDALP